jgi:ribose 5-phosphate isomerase A
MLNTNFDKQKMVAAEKATEFVEDGMLIGLGTGSTVQYMVEVLADKVKSGLNIEAVSTSVATTKLAASLGITVLNFNDIDNIDLTIDGADEVDPKLNGIKGGGGALLYEKIVASSSNKNIWMVDSSKYVEQLGKFPLPLEVVPYGANHTFTKLVNLGYNPKFRMKDNEYYLTDGKHFIIDLHLNKIENYVELNGKLLSIPGVIETGLFFNICDVLIMGIDDGVRVIPKLEKDRS